MKKIPIILLFLFSVHAQLVRETIGDSTKVKLKNSTINEKLTSKSVKDSVEIKVNQAAVNTNFQLFKLYGGEHRSNYLSANNLLPHQIEFKFKGFSLADHFNASFVETRYQNDLLEKTL